MIIIDTALRAREQQGRPIRVGMLGAGFMARGLANQIVNSTPGMRLVAIYNRHVERAFDAYMYAGTQALPRLVDRQHDLDDAIRAACPVVTGDAMLLCRSEQIDVTRGRHRAPLSSVRTPSWKPSAMASTSCS